MPEPNDNLSEDFAKAMEAWRRKYQLREDDPLLLCLELFRIQQDHWDDIRRKDVPSFAEFRDSLTQGLIRVKALRQITRIRRAPIPQSIDPPVKERPANAVRAKRSLEKERDKLLAKLHEINHAIHEAETDTANSEKTTLAKLRGALGWSRNQLSRVMNASDRAIVNWEQGDPMSPVYAAKLREIQSIYNELKQLMRPEEIGPWLLTEMEEFEGRTPVDLISKGETGRLWASLFYLRSGMPD